MKRLLPAVACGLAVAATARAQAGPTLPFSQQGVLHGAPYTIKLPANWNGTLVVYMHGYRAVPNRPWEVEDDTAYPAPSPVEDPGQADMEPYLLARGYGLAGSAFRAQGYNIQEGIEGTRELLAHFRGVVGKPARTILLGLSGGAVMGNEILETGSGLADGAISACGVDAGTPLFFDRSLAFAVAYDAAFGWPAEWGTPGDVRDDIDFESEVLPLFLPHLFNPDDFGKLEFVRIAAGIPVEGYYDGPSLLFAHMFFTTEARAQLELKFGGPGVQNLDHTYAVSADDAAYLAALGVNAAPLVGAMNAHRIYDADPGVRRYVNKYASFNGNIKKPLLSMHAIHDGLATIDNESVYASINADAGRQDDLVQVFTDGIGHCTFSEEQYLSAIQAMESWLDTGAKPGDAFFPAPQGFVRPFAPPSWPQPIR